MTLGKLFNTPCVQLPYTNCGKDNTTSCIWCENQIGDKNRLRNFGIKLGNIKDIFVFVFFFPFSLNRQWKYAREKENKHLDQSVMETMTDFRAFLAVASHAFISLVSLLSDSSC